MDLTWENVVNLGVTGGLTLVFLLLIRWMVPRYLRRFLAWVDSIIPADLSAFFDATSRFIQRALSAMVLLAAGLTVAVAGVQGANHRHHHNRRCDGDTGGEPHHGPADTAVPYPTGWRGG